MRKPKISLMALTIVCGGLFASPTVPEVVVIVSAKAPVETLSVAQVADIFLGKSANFPNGARAVPIDQADGSAIRRAFYAKATGKSPQLLKAYWSKLIFTGQGEPPREVMDSAAIKKLVAANPNFIAYVEKSAVDVSVRTVLTVR